MFAAALIAIHKVRAEMHGRGCIGSDSSGIVGFEHMFDLSWTTFSTVVSFLV